MPTMFLDDTQVDERTQSLIQILEGTPYNCSSLEELSGGSANYVYRGVLIHPLPSRDGSLSAKTVIVKYSLSHIPGNTEFAIDLSRCAVETSMLNRLNESSIASKSVIVPNTYHAHRETQESVQVQEDFPQSHDVASLMRSSELDGLLTQATAISVSREVGVWLRSFHEWASASQQASFRREIGCNEPMQKLKHQVTYGTLLSILKNFPDVLEDNIEVLRKVKQRAESELEDFTSGKEGEYRGIIHGDCWMGNVLLSNIPPEENVPSASTDIILIDWELAQFGHRAYDLGHMIGDLYETYHFHNSESALLSIQSLMDGYGEIDNEMAFRTAIHAGVQLLGWYNRRAPHSPVKGTPEQITSAAKISTDFIVKGWEKDGSWFQRTALAPLFKFSC